MAGLFLVFLLAYIDKTKGIILISSLFMIVITIESVRLLMPDVNRLFFRYFNPLLREEEEKKPTGTTYYLGGVLLSLLLFDRGIALFAVTILAVGDPAASTIGKRWGRYRIKGKSLEGSIAFLITSTLAGLMLQRLWSGLTVGVIITGATVGALAELMSTTLNDNLLIPLAASGAMEALSSFLNLVHLD